MSQYHQILVGIDFSRASRAAVRTAARFSSFFGGRMTLLHVIDSSSANAFRQDRGALEADMLEEARERVYDFLADSEVRTYRPDVRVEVGRPLDVIGATCRRLGVDLLVLGTHGTVHETNQIGTLAAQCVRRAPAHVLLVRGHVDHPFRRILACVDFSETAAHAVEHARVVGEKDNAELDCLFVFQSAVARSLPDEGHPLPTLVTSPEAFEGWKQELDAFLHPLLGNERRVPWRGVVEERAEVREAIYQYAEARDVDLVVLGTRGKSDLRALLIGSTAEKVVSHGSCSVLVVRPRTTHGCSKKGVCCDGLNCGRSEKVS